MRERAKVRQGPALAAAAPWFDELLTNGQSGLARIVSNNSTLDKQTMSIPIWISAQHRSGVSGNGVCEHSLTDAVGRHSAKTSHLSLLIDTVLLIDSKGKEDQKDQSDAMMMRAIIEPDSVQMSSSTEGHHQTPPIKPINLGLQTKVNFNTPDECGGSTFRELQFPFPSSPKDSILERIREWQDGSNIPTMLDVTEEDLEQNIPGEMRWSTKFTRDDDGGLGTQLDDTVYRTSHLCGNGTTNHSDSIGEHCWALWSHNGQNEILDLEEEEDDNQQYVTAKPVPAKRHRQVHWNNNNNSESTEPVIQSTTANPTAITTNTTAQLLVPLLCACQCGSGGGDGGSTYPTTGGSTALTTTTTTDTTTSITTTTSIISTSNSTTTTTSTTSSSLCCQCCCCSRCCARSAPEEINESYCSGGTVVVVQQPVLQQQSLLTDSATSLSVSSSLQCSTVTSCLASAAVPCKCSQCSKGPASPSIVSSHEVCAQSFESTSSFSSRSTSIPFPASEQVYKPTSRLVELSQTANQCQQSPPQFRVELTRFLCDRCSLRTAGLTPHLSSPSSSRVVVTSVPLSPDHLSQQDDGPFQNTPEQQQQHSISINKRYFWFELSLELVKFDGATFTSTTTTTTTFTVHQLFRQLSVTTTGEVSVNSSVLSNPSLSSSLLSSLLYKCFDCCQLITIVVVPDDDEDNLVDCAALSSLPANLVHCDQPVFYLCPNRLEPVNLCSSNLTHSLGLTFELVPLDIAMVEQTQLVSPSSTGTGSTSALLHHSHHHHHHRNLHHFHLPHYRTSNHRYGGSALVVTNANRNGLTNGNHHHNNNNSSHHHPHHEPPPQRPSSSVSSGSAGSKSDHSVNDGDDISTPLSTGNSSLSSTDSSDYEYGPGIVDRLRHKFMALAKNDPTMNGQSGKLAVCGNVNHVHLLSSIMVKKNHMKRCSSMEELTYHNQLQQQQQLAKSTPNPPAIVQRIPKKNHQQLNGAKKRIVQWNMNNAHNNQLNLLQLNHIEPQVNGFSERRLGSSQASLPSPTNSSQPSPVSQSNNNNSTTSSVESSALSPKPVVYPSNIVKQYVKNQNLKHSALMLNTCNNTNVNGLTVNGPTQDGSHCNGSPGKVQPLSQSLSTPCATQSPTPSPLLSPNVRNGSQQNSNNLVLLTSPIPYIKRSKSVETLSCTFNSHNLLHLAAPIDCTTSLNSNGVDSTVITDPDDSVNNSNDDNAGFVRVEDALSANCQEEEEPKSPIVKGQLSPVASLSISNNNDLLAILSPTTTTVLETTPFTASNDISELSSPKAGEWTIEDDHHSDHQHPQQPVNNTAAQLSSRTPASKLSALLSEPSAVATIPEATISSSSSYRPVALSSPPIPDSIGNVEDEHEQQQHWQQQFARDDEPIVALDLLPQSSPVSSSSLSELTVATTITTECNGALHIDDSDTLEVHCPVATVEEGTDSSLPKTQTTPTLPLHHYQIRDSEMPKADIVKTYKRLFEPVPVSGGTGEPPLMAVSTQSPVTSPPVLPPVASHSSQDSCLLLSKPSQALPTVESGVPMVPTKSSMLSAGPLSPPPPPPSQQPPPPIPTRNFKPVVCPPVSVLTKPRTTTTATGLFNGKVVSTRPTPPTVPKRNLPVGVTGNGLGSTSPRSTSNIYKRPVVNAESAIVSAVTSSASSSSSTPSVVSRFANRNCRPAPSVPALSSQPKFASPNLKPVSSVVSKTAPPIPTGRHFQSKSSQGSVPATPHSSRMVSAILQPVSSRILSEGPSLLSPLKSAPPPPLTSINNLGGISLSPVVVSSTSATTSSTTTTTSATAAVSKSVPAKVSDNISQQSIRAKTWSPKPSAPLPPPPPPTVAAPVSSPPPPPPPQPLLLPSSASLSSSPPSPLLSPPSPPPPLSIASHNHNNNHNSLVSVKKKPVANIRPFQSEPSNITTASSVDSSSSPPAPTSLSDSSTLKSGTVVSSSVCVTPISPSTTTSSSSTLSPNGDDNNGCAKMLLSSKSVASSSLSAASSKVTSTSNSSVSVATSHSSKPETLKPSLLTGGFSASNNSGSLSGGLPLKSTLWSSSSPSAGKSSSSAMMSVSSSQCSSSSSSMVFDFRDKNVKPNIAIQPTPFGAKPIQRHLIQQIEGVDSANYSEDDYEDSNYCGTMQPPPPSGITFVGENVPTARGALLIKRNKNLSLKFNDSATSIHSYIVEVFDSDSEEDEDEVDHHGHEDEDNQNGHSRTSSISQPHSVQQTKDDDDETGGSGTTTSSSSASSLSSNSTVLQNKFLTGSSSLGTYKPASSQIDRSFQLGITKSSSSNAPNCDKLSSMVDDSSLLTNGSDTPGDINPTVVIKPTPIEETVTFSQSTTASDLLF